MVRTKSLAVVTTTAALVTVYTVPAGKTAILKWITAHNPNVLGVSTQVALRRAGVDRLVFAQNVGASSVISLASYVVLGPGDALRVVSSTAGVAMTLSGVELAGVSP